MQRQDDKSITDLNWYRFSRIMAEIKYVLLPLLCFVLSFAQAGEIMQSSSKVIRLSTGEHVVVTEGEFEPRSIGSYSLRVYSASNPQFPYDDFKVGIIRPRNGALEQLLINDIDLDGVEDIIVVNRSAGTGGYLSADAFQYKSKQLIPIVSVEWLDKYADPVQVMRDTVKAGR